MIQLNNTVSRIQSQSGWLSIDQNSSVDIPSTFLGMESSSLSNNTTCSSILLAFTTTLLALISAVWTKVLRAKWRKILFGLACLFALMGIIFTILCFLYRSNNVTRVAFWSMWFLISRKKSSEYSIIFTVFTITYEYALLNFILQIAFTVTECKMTSTFSNHLYELDSNSPLSTFILTVFMPN
ncbi:hypothetical protein MN116_007562 [Schistosoma mekongi]|uniref:Uncharacterized protein n=1 Tax=Schistosoma mekongi TaxID=38744 RepID=A0AAE1Z7X4_SCHME|nr:hypothetical protein MN116_007562 [Schistosoma mekongi]